MQICADPSHALDRLMQNLPGNESVQTILEKIAPFLPVCCHRVRQEGVGRAFGSSEKSEPSAMIVPVQKTVGYGPWLALLRPTSRGSWGTERQGFGISAARSGANMVLLLQS